MRTESTVDIVEANGKDFRNVLAPPALSVCDHALYRGDLVVLTVPILGDASTPATIVVSARELQAAIENATRRP